MKQTESGRNEAEQTNTGCREQWVSLQHNDRRQAEGQGSRQTNSTHTTHKKERINKQNLNIRQRKNLK